MYTLEEVKRHRTKESLWVIQGSDIYDVTDFAGRHPGGMEIILQHGGQDVTAVMQDYRFHQHSGAAYLILKKSYIGKLESDTKSPMVSKKYNIFVNLRDMSFAGKISLIRILYLHICV